MKKKKIIFKITLSVFFLLILFKAGGAIAANNFQKEEEHYINKYVNVIVIQGDTLWSLAKKHGNSKKDIRKIIYEIQNINGLKSSEYIHPGQILKIPID